MNWQRKDPASIMYILDIIKYITSKLLNDEFGGCLQKVANPGTILSLLFSCGGN